MSRQAELPLQQGLLCRPRLHALIRDGLQHPLLVMLAGPGYGKTQAMTAFLAEDDRPAIWVRMGSLDNLHAHFWLHLAHALAEGFPTLAGQMRTLGFPDTPARFDAFLRILAEGFAGHGQVIWVLDDFGEITDPGIKSFFWTLVEADLDSLRIVMLSNLLADTESIAFMTHRRALILGKDLQFTREEIAALYALHGVPLEAGGLDEAEHYTEGWALPLHLLVLQRGRIPEPTGQGGRLSNQAVTRMFENRFFSGYTGAQQKLLAKLSLLSTFTEDFADLLCAGDAAAAEVLDGHVFLTGEPATGRFIFHHLYHQFLQRKGRQLLTEAEMLAVWRHAADYFMSAGNTVDAIACYRKSGNHVGMLRAIGAFVQSLHGVSIKDADYILEHLDLLTAEEVREYPIADYLRAVTYLNTLELEKADALLEDLERRLSGGGAGDERTLLGECCTMRGALHMMLTREDFGSYFEKAAGLLPNGSTQHGRENLSTLNNHSFSMADNQPGALQRMERAVHYGVPWMARVMGGTMSGMEHLFSAEAAYLTGRFDEARQHAWRAIYQAAAHAQHDLVCNAHCVLARIGLMQEDLAEMTRQVTTISEYAAKYNIGALNEIRDTILAWYYIKLRDYALIPKNIASMNDFSKPALARDRSQIVYANYLISTGDYAQMVGMLEYPQGLFVTRGIWPDRICLYIMLAIGHHHLENTGAAMQALWTAYDMSYNNGLTTLFIEAEDRMRALVDCARRQTAFAFAPEWLDQIDAAAAEYIKKVTGVRAAYRKRNPARPAADNPLTRREVEILQALSMGLTREEIAIAQFVSVNTVKTFIRSIYNKLDAANRAEAVSIAISNGYIDISATEQKQP